MRRAGIICVFVLVATAAGADTLELAKGETLTGRLTRFADGVVQFRTRLAGNIIVPVDEVVRLKSTKPVLVKLKSGATLEGVMTLTPAAVSIEKNDGSHQRVPLDQVSTIKPAPSEKDPEKEALSLAAETGALYRFGQDDYADAFGRVRLSTELDNYLFGAGLFVERADPDEFPRWLAARTSLRFQPERLWQPAIGLDFERDTDKALRARTGLNAGLVRSFPTLGLEAEAGLLAESSQWRAHPTDEDLNLRLSLRYARQFFENGAFSSSLSFTPSLTDSDRFRAASQTSLAFPFDQRMHLKLNLLIDYEDYPQMQEIQKWRTTVGASLLWGFKDSR